MAFRTYCTNKGCMKENAPLLEVSTSKILCGECGEEITNLTQFVKGQLKTLGQTTERLKKNKPFSVKCQSCKKEGRPLLKNDQLTCSSCSLELKHLSAPFERMIRDVLSNQKED